MIFLSSMFCMPIGVVLLLQGLFSQPYCWTIMGEVSLPILEDTILQQI